MEKNIAASKIFDAINALKEKASKQDDNSGNKEVDLISIVKKLSRNRDRSSKNSQ